MNRLFLLMIVSTTLLFSETFMRLPVEKSTQNSVKNSPYSTAFIDLAKSYANKQVEFDHLKAVTLAMMMLESGRGTSDLATKHYNFGGLKYRPEMRLHASKVYYKASDGFDNYCKFDSPEAFIGGFWAFIDRNPYRGWRNYAYSEKSFVEFIAPIYCPFNPDYAQKVLSLVPEAKKLLASYEKSGFTVALNSRN